MRSVMFLPPEQKMQGGTAVWKDEVDSPGQGEDWEARTDQSCVSQIRVPVKDFPGKR